MHQDCDRCGVFGLCDKEGICNDCRYEESEENNEQDGEEKAEEAKEDED